MQGARGMGKCGLPTEVLAYPDRHAGNISDSLQSGPQKNIKRESRQSSADARN